MKSGRSNGRLFPQSRYAQKSHLPIQLNEYPSVGPVACIGFTERFLAWEISDGGQNREQTYSWFVKAKKRGNLVYAFDDIWAVPVFGR